MEAYYGNGKYIFISYAHKDEKIVYPIIEELQNYFNVWYDDGIAIGDDYRKDILNHLKYSSLFLFFVTPNSLSSDFYKKEIHFAESRGINFINILLEDFTLPDWFDFDYGHLQHFPFHKHKNISSAVAELVKRKPEWFAPVTGDELVSSGLTIEEMFGINREEKTIVKPKEKAVIKPEPKKVDPPKETKKVEIKPEKKKSPFGMEPEFSDDKKTVTYGLYPQTVVDDKNLLKHLNDLDEQFIEPRNGWYFYNNEYYAKVKAKPKEKNYVLSNGKAFKNGGVYWFKCEPIVWNVLSNKNGEVLLISSILLDAHRYNEYFYLTKNGYYPNNYEQSEIRSWLNNEFYKSAFALNDNYIKITKVINSSASTGYSSNPYACSDTEDKVFLLSYKDYSNDEYGFTSNTSRILLTTDYAKAKGISCDASSNGFYYTRSPIGNGDYAYGSVFAVNTIGKLENLSLSYNDFGVRPAITIKI